MATTKRSLKDAVSVTAKKDDFVKAGGVGEAVAKPADEPEIKTQITKVTNRQTSKSRKVIPAKVVFYLDPQTENAMEELRLELRRRHRKKYTRSQIADGLLKTALKDPKIREHLA